MKTQTKNKMTGKVILCIFFAACCIFITSNSYSQGAAINTTGAVADASAMLDISSTTSGLLIPRMNAAERNAIPSPATGLHIFNTDCNVDEYYSGTCWISMGQNLKEPGIISCSGTTAFCGNESRTFAISPVTGATSYLWTVPPGASLTSGQGTTSVTVQFGNYSGSVCVTAENTCETSLTRCIDLAVNTTPTAPLATNNGPLCGGQTLTLMTNVVPGAVYSWTGPNNFTSNMPNPTLSNVASANAGTYNLTLSVNGCVSSAGSTTLVVSNGSPLQPGAITGATSNLGGQNNVTYSISPVNLATNYTWTVPAGATITGGQGTLSITVDFTCSGSGSITVTANNACGISPPQTLGVSTDLVSPGAITGNTIVCPNSTQTYSISPLAYATSYTWTIPVGASLISGQGTTSISVGVGMASGNITVSQTSFCGTTATTTFAINNALSTFTQSTGFTGIPVTFSPTSTFTGATYNWTFQSGSPSTSTSQNPSVTWSSTGNYNVSLTVNGCSPSTTTSVNVKTLTVQTFNITGTGRTGTIQTFTVPITGTYTIEVLGAEGGWGGQSGSAWRGGLGASMRGDFSLNAGQQLKILVGQQGSGNISNTGGGGGGGSYVITSTNTPLIVAGGGGGGGYSSSTPNGGKPGLSSIGNGNGGGNSLGPGDEDQAGAGFNTDGWKGSSTGVAASAFLNGGYGGIGMNNSFGGYGGGGGGGNSFPSGGSGGGYQGGEASGSCWCDTGSSQGGLSYNNGTNQLNSSGVQSGNGKVTISY